MTATEMAGVIATLQASRPDDTHVGSQWRQIVAGLAATFATADRSFDRAAFFAEVGFDVCPPAEPTDPWDHAPGPCAECGVDHPFVCGVVDTPARATVAA